MTIVIAIAMTTATTVTMMMIRFNRELVDIFEILYLQLVAFVLICQFLVLAFWPCLSAM